MHIENQSFYKQKYIINFLPPFSTRQKGHIKHSLGNFIYMYVELFYITVNDISVIYVMAQMCRPPEEECWPTIWLPCHRHFRAFFKVPVQALTLGNSITPQRPHHLYRAVGFNQLGHKPRLRSNLWCHNAGVKNSFYSPSRTCMGIQRICSFKKKI